MRVAAVTYAMTPEEISQLRRYAIRLREIVAREESLGTERAKLPSWTDTKRMLLTWADDLDREAHDAER